MVDLVEGARVLTADQHAVDAVAVLLHNRTRRLGEQRDHVETTVPVGGGSLGVVDEDGLVHRPRVT